MSNILKENEARKAMDMIKTINRIENIEVDPKTEDACMRILMGQSSEKEELRGIISNIEEN